MFYWFPFVIISYGGHGIAKGTFVSLEGKNKLPLCGKRRRKIQISLPAYTNQRLPNQTGKRFSWNLATSRRSNLCGNVADLSLAPGGRCYMLLSGWHNTEGDFANINPGKYIYRRYNATCRVSQVDGTPCNWNLPFPCPAPTILSVGAFGK